LHYYNKKPEATNLKKEKVNLVHSFGSSKFKFRWLHWLGLVKAVGHHGGEHVGTNDHILN
jgi:hypothetical protein